MVCAGCVLQKCAGGDVLEHRDPNRFGGVRRIELWPHSQPGSAEASGGRSTFNQYPEQVRRTRPDAKSWAQV